MKDAYENGVAVDRPDLLVGIDDIMKLMDYDGVHALERKVLPQDVLERKYDRGAVA